MILNNYPMIRKFISLLLFIGLVFCQNSGANKVELSEPELSNIASESIKESMKTYSTPNLILASMSLGVFGIYLGEFIHISFYEGNDNGNVIIFAPGIIGFGLPYYISRKKMRSWKIERNNFSDIGDIAEGKGGGISYQDLSSIYNNELAAIAAKNSIDKNNKINSLA